MNNKHEKSLDRTTRLDVALSPGEEWHILNTVTDYRPGDWRELVERSRSAIEENRKRDVILRLHDRRGKPLAHRAVHIAQTESDFLWGFCGWGVLNALRNGSATCDPTQRKFRYYTQLFNSVNLMHYWAEKHCSDAPVNEEFQGFPDYDNLQQGVDWALANGLTPKGHPIFWPVDKAIPDWLQRYDYDTKMKYLEVRVRTLVSRFRGKMGLYDAINEAIWEPSFAKTQERHWPHLTPIDEIVEYLEPVLRWAREEDPDARYLLNDYGVMLGHSEEIPVPAHDGRRINRDFQARRYRELIDALRQRGVAPDAVGIQGFFGGWGHHDMDVATLDFLGTETGLPVHITEFQPGGEHVKRLLRSGVDRDTIMERIWEYTQNVLVTAFAHPAVEAFYIWHDLDYLFDDKGYPSYLYRSMHELIRKEWRTNLTLHTDEHGVIRFRGFCGSYRARMDDLPQVRGTGFHLPESCRGGLQMDLAVSL
jgi:GH35 family endo-1,4-beta-xylanase